MKERLACKYENGKIYWRGSNEDWRYKPTDEAIKLAIEFRSEAKKYGYVRDLFLEYARQIEAAIRAYDRENEHVQARTDQAA